MKKCMTLAYISILIGSALAGCTQDNPDNPGNAVSDSKAIMFAPNTVYTRSGDITSSNLDKFQVYAYTETGTNPTLFMDNVTVSRTSSNTWVYSPLEYWPTVPVDFFAFAPAGNWAGAHGPFGTLTPYTDYPGDTDLVYAVSRDNTGNTNGQNAQVILNFRHALSKVCINLSSSDENIEVKVSNVVMVNILTDGIFHFPSLSTSPLSTDTNSVCSWTDLKSNATYIFHTSQTPSERITLTTTPTDMSEIGHKMGGAKYMIPQELPYHSSSSDRDSYLAVMCSIYDTKSGLQLWPNENTPPSNTVPGSTFKDGILEFPLSTSEFSGWQPGHYYIYNVTINSNPDMGAINFGMPTVEGFVNVETTYQ